MLSLNGARSTMVLRRLSASLTELKDIGENWHLLRSLPGRRAAQAGLSEAFHILRTVNWMNFRLGCCRQQLMGKEEGVWLI